MAAGVLAMAGEMIRRSEMDEKVMYRVDFWRQLITPAFVSKTTKKFVMFKRISAMGKAFGAVDFEDGREWWRTGDHCWHETFEEAKNSLAGHLELKIDRLENQIGNLKDVLFKIEDLKESDYEKSIPGRTSGD